MTDDKKPSLPKDPARKKNVQNFIFWAVIVVLLGASGYLLIKAFGGSNPVKKEEQKQEETQKEEQKTEEVTEEEVPEVSGSKYVVKDGDTLFSIAKANGVTMDALQKANNLDDPNKLKIGQELIIPTASDTEKTESTDGGTTSNDKDTP